jgi:hypothetical protein
LRDEEHAHNIWGSNFVLLRADGHVAWRGQEAPGCATAKEILDVVTGQKTFPGYVPAKYRVINIDGISVPSENFSETELLALGESV